MTIYTKLKALAEAGRKATQGEWCVHQCQEWHEPSERLSFHYPIRETDGLTDIIPDENGDQDYPNIPHDMVFAATAANTRPALDEIIELLEPIEGLSEALLGLVASSSSGEGFNRDDLNVVFEAAQRFQKMSEG